MAPTPDDLVIVPANEAGWEELQTILGTRGTGAYCQCQRFKLNPREAFGSFPVEERTSRLRQQTQCGEPHAEGTSGLVAYLDGEPVGWCAVEPRPAYVGLVRNNRVPWTGREEDRSDVSVWSVTCVFVRAGFRRQGISRDLVAAALLAQALGQLSGQDRAVLAAGAAPGDLGEGLPRAGCEVPARRGLSRRATGSRTVGPACPRGRSGDRPADLRRGDIVGSGRHSRRHEAVQARSARRIRVLHR